MNDEIMREGGFSKEVEAVRQGKCPFCRLPINLDDFKDNLSRQEYFISGLCASCQQKMFEEEEE